MRGRGKLAVAAVVVLAAAVYIFFGNGRSRPPVAAEAGDELHAPVPGGSLEVASRAHARSTRVRAGARMPVPRFAPAAADAADAGPARHPRRLARGGDGGLQDRRPPAERGDSVRLRRELESRFAEARAAIDVCLDRWPAEDEALRAGVMLAIEIDERGLEAVWFEDVEEIPQGPLACISNAVYPIDWAGLTTKPLKMTVRLRYESDAAAP